MRDSHKRMALIGGAVAVVVGAAGFGAYALTGDEERSGGGTRPTADGGKPAVPTGPPTTEETRTAAAEFLGAWADGDLAGAAALTDDRAAASGALTGFREKAHVAAAEFVPGRPSGAAVPFDVRARITYKEKTVPWTYASRLEVVREAGTGEAVVRWEPSVLHPDLKEGQSVATGESGTAPIKAVDRDGAELTKEAHPGLTGLLADLRKRYGGKAGGIGGIETRVVDAKGKDTGRTLKTLSKGEPGTLRTTIDAGVQRAAEAAVSAHAKAGVVAIKPSTGEILAVANAPAGGFDTALQGQYAPGSTMKVITAALLMDKGLAAPGAAHPCPKYFTYGHWKFQNDDKFEIRGGTFTQSFMRSCNTAFISQAPELKDDDLTREAREVFGLGLNWQVGATTFDGRVPVQSDAQMGASLIGQGGVRMSPLAMASVAATAKSGTFRQPYIVAPSVDGRTLATAPRAMKPQVAAGLRQLMHLTATGGTAAQAMAGMGGDFGAKTGSAEVGGQKKPNAWFTAYRDDIAVAAVVPNSGHGGEFAGPLVRKVLDASGG